MFKEPTADDSGMYNCTVVYDRISNLHAGVELIFYRKYQISLKVTFSSLCYL